MKRHDPEQSRDERDERQALAERIRQALLAAAEAAHEDAGIRGLCCEGQWEAVQNALRGFDLAPIVDGSRGISDPDRNS